MKNQHHTFQSIFICSFCVYWHQYWWTQSIPTLGVLAEHDCSLIFCVLFCFLCLVRAADSWCRSKGLSMRKLIPPSFVSTTSGFYSIKLLGCSSAFWSFKGAAVWVPICLQCAYDYYFLSRSTNRISSPFSIISCFSLLLLGWKFPEMLFSKNLQNKKQIVSAECYLPFLFSALLATQRFH